MKLTQIISTPIITILILCTGIQSSLYHYIWIISWANCLFSISHYQYTIIIFNIIYS